MNLKDMFDSECHAPFKENDRDRKSYDQFQPPLQIFRVQDRKSIRSECDPETKEKDDTGKSKKGSQDLGKDARDQGHDQHLRKG